ncbi:beclin 1, partial [Nannochloropsis gaditana CCMP526]|uniref:beclin 1 n=1 Tax=Nannochloropsis gaditana (strain CCMP526) TaxID=1093141 RepID=UPI00029F73E1
MPSEGDGPEAHILHLREKLKAVEARRITLHRRRALVEKKRRRLQGLLDLWQSLNNSAAEALLDLSESHQATHGSELSAGARLEALTQLNVANDCFHVWHSGPFATMNGCSIGRLPAFAAVEWTDINAGLGQAILLLDTLVKQTGFRFRRLELVPFGSFSKILRSPCDLYGRGDEVDAEQSSNHRQQCHEFLLRRGQPGVFPSSEHECGAGCIPAVRGGVRIPRGGARPHDPPPAQGAGQQDRRSTHRLDARRRGHMEPSSQVPIDRPEMALGLECSTCTAV